MNNPTYKHHFRFYGQKNGLKIDFGAILFLKVNDISKKKKFSILTFCIKKAPFAVLFLRLCFFLKRNIIIQICRSSSRRSIPTVGRRTW